MATNAPPAAEESEIQIIGSLLMAPERIHDAAKIGKLDFRDPCNAAAFDTIRKMSTKNVPIDRVTLKQELESTAIFSRSVTPEDYLHAVVESVVTCENLPYHASLVLEASRKCRLLEIGNYVIESAMNGKASDDILVDLGSDIFELQRDQVSNDGLKSMPLPDFLKQDFSIDCLIEGVIVAKQPGIIAAKSKSQKTTVTLDACLSLASGTSFMGKWRVPKPISVGIMSAESGGATISETFRRIAASKDIDPELYRNLHVSTVVPAMCEPKGQDLVERYIENNELQCLFIDPTYLATAGIEDNSLSSMAKVLGPVSAIIERTGCSIVFVHHNRKTTPKPYGEPTLEEITGAGWAQWARYWILLNKRREWDPDAGQHWLWMCTGSSSGFGSRHFLDVYEGHHTDPDGRSWHLEFSTPSEGKKRENEQQQAGKEAKQMESDRSKVRANLAKHSKGLCKSRMLAGISRNRWDAVLETTHDDGDIVECQIIVGNQMTPRPGYKLASKEAT
jgi:hypothetical protein